MNTAQTMAIRETTSTMPKPWRDPLFLLALCAGPLAWLAFLIWTPILSWTPTIFWTNPLTVGLALVVYPVLEEWLFRGRIQGALAAGRLGRRQWIGFTAANLVTSLLFAAFHLLNHPPLWAALVLFPSLLFGLFRDRYQGIGPSILLHAFYNAGYFSIWPPS
jgi:membrane protease YdiL (CAAX protease family)